MKIGVAKSRGIKTITKKTYIILFSFMAVSALVQKRKTLQRKVMTV
jgi:hypothetical protein